MVTKQAIFRRAIGFFMRNAGYIVGQHFLGAVQLARAEKWASDNGYTFEWSSDDDADLGDHELWCAEARRDKAGYDQYGHYIGGISHRPQCQGHYAEYCAMKNEDGEVVQSLGGILDASNEYRRVIEAELALEEMAEHTNTGFSLTQN